MKNAIVQVDANPFRLWYQTHYGVELGLKKAEDIKKAEEAALKPEEAKVGGREGAKGHVAKQMFTEPCRFRHEKSRVMVGR